MSLALDTIDAMIEEVAALGTAVVRESPTECASLEVDEWVGARLKAYKAVRSAVMIAEMKALEAGQFVKLMEAREAR